MPRFDGTGPRGEGPMTGRGEGYCAVRLPDRPGEPAYGYAGLQGRPVGFEMSLASNARFPPRWPRPVTGRGLAFRRGRGRGAWRGRGRRFARR